VILSQNQPSRETVRPRSPSLTYADALMALVAGALSQALYVRTLAPGLLPGDSGEFQALAYLLGDTHPTGYPVYLLLAKPLTWLPLGDVAYRVNLFSAVMAALTVAGIYLAGRLLTGYRGPALLGALILAVSPTFWSQALIAEVYTPGAAFFIAVLLMLLLWNGTGEARYLFASGVLGGLSVGVHMSGLLLAPAAGLFLLLSRRRGGATWRPALLGALTGAALALIAFLVVDHNDPTANYFGAAVQPSRSAWGFEATDLDQPLERLAFGLSARQFHPFMFADPAEVMPRLAQEYLIHLPEEISPLALVLAGLGAVGLLVRRPRLALLLLLALASQWLYTFNYDIWDLYVFHISGYGLLALLAGTGAGCILDSGISLARAKRARRVIEPLLAAALLVLCLWPILAPHWEEVVAGGPPSFGFDEYPVDAFTLDPFHSVVTATVSDLPEGSIVFTGWDMLYPLYYAAHIEQGRGDLTFVETFPRDDVEGLADSVIEYVEAQLPRRPVFFSERVAELQEAGYAFGPLRAGPTMLYRVRAATSGD
jgi:hypothetical protein